MSSQGNAWSRATPPPPPPLPHAELTPPAVLQTQAQPALDPTEQVRNLPPPRRSRALVVGIVAAVALAAILLALRRKHESPVTTALPARATPVAPTVTPLPPAEMAVDPAAPAPTERSAPAAAAPPAAHEKVHAAPSRERPAPRRKRPHARAVGHKTSTGPGRVAAHAAYARGNGLLFTGDAAGAVAAYQEAVRLAPADPSGYRGLGLAYEKEGKVDDAIAALVSYLKLSRHAHDREVVARRLYRLTHPHDE